MTWRITQADVLEGLAQIPDASVQTVVTSPPYWGLRDYGTPGQLGLEPTPEAYVAKMVEVFREVRRVLRPDGTVWLNLGDAYTSQGGNGRAGFNGQVRVDQTNKDQRIRPQGVLKPKDLVGIPWRVAFALQADGWYLRSDIIWSKPNPMPESVTDRPTKAHEYVFLLTRSARYFYDADAVREAHVDWREGPNHPVYMARADSHEATAPRRWNTAENLYNPAGRNLRSVWNIATEPYPEAHFATFPKALVVPCVKAGTSEKGCCPECGAAWVRQTSIEYVKNRPSAGDDPRSRSEDRQAQGSLGGHHGWRGNNLLRDATTTGWRPTCVHAEVWGEPDGQGGTAHYEPVPCTVLDPFAGSGTVGVVALRHGRSFIGIELNPTYAEMARERIRNDAPLWNHAAEVTA